MFTFPTTADNPQRLVNLLGSYWPVTFAGADLVVAYCYGGNAAEQQLFQDVLELQNSVGRYTCPVFNTELWYSLTCKLSDEVSAETIEYGEGFIYGTNGPDATMYHYGQSIVGAKAYTAPAELNSAYYAANAITNPTVIFSQGIDFAIDAINQKIVFSHSLFDNQNITPTPIIENDVVIDYEVTVWIYRAQLDRDWFYEQFGYIIPLNLTSSERYKQAVNAILSSYTSATSYDNVAELLEAIADCPRVIFDNETVEVITTDSVYQLIITDKNVYRYSLTASPIVTVGQVVNEDDQLVDTVTIFEPSGGQSPSLTSITLDNSFLDHSVLGPLTFNNSNTALNVTLNVSGFTKVDWALGGAAGDVTQFFDVLHTKGIAAGKTLAMCLDTRPQPQATQPTAFNLPATINPMKFLFENVFRANAFIVILKTAGFGPNALGVTLLPLLRNMIPPHSTAITIVQ